jgi:hypothetical protein
MCFSYELCASRLCGDVEEWLINGFAKKEERGHEPMETLRRQCCPQGAAVPHYLCNTSHLVPKFMIWILSLIKTVSQVLFYVTFV